MMPLISFLAAPSRRKPSAFGDLAISAGSLPSEQTTPLAVLVSVLVQIVKFRRKKKKHQQLFAVCRARCSGLGACWVGFRGTISGKGHLARGSPPSSCPRRCTGRWGRAHIGLAESTRGEIRCGRRQEHRHRRRETRGLVLSLELELPALLHVPVHCAAQTPVRYGSLHLDLLRAGLGLR